MPLRPIVSAINSPTHPLAKFLVKIISPVTGKTNSYIKNSTHFMEKINSPAINSKDYMISFDVVSLFTKVPIKEVILILKIILEQDQP